MDHGYVKDVGQAEYSDRKESTLKQVLRVVFSWNGVPKTLVSDNSVEFSEDSL